jgi:hypothetical protein
MRCTVCRGEYFTVHNCPGTLYMGDVKKPGGNFIPGYYIAEALKIFRLDRLAIRRIEHDKQSMLYSVPIWFIAAYLASIILGIFAIVLQRYGTATGSILNIAVQIVILPIIQGAALIVQLGILHGLARGIFNGQGTYVRVLRPYLFGSVIPVIFSIVPVLGTFIGGVWGLVIYAWIFEEVEGISRIQAIGLSVVGSLALTALTILLGV